MKHIEVLVPDLLCCPQVTNANIDKQDPSRKEKKIKVTSRKKLLASTYVEIFSGG